MRRALNSPHLQCLHDFLGGSLSNWTCEKVYTLTLIFKKPLYDSENGISHEAGQFVFLGSGGMDFLFVASLDIEVLRKIHLTADLAWSQDENKHLWPNYGLVDPEKLSAIILGGLNSKRAFEDPEAYSPKRHLLLGSRDYEELVQRDPHCFLLALGLPRLYKPPPM